MDYKKLWADIKKAAQSYKPCGGKTNSRHQSFRLLCISIRYGPRRFISLYPKVTKLDNGSYNTYRLHSYGNLGLNSENSHSGITFNVSHIPLITLTYEHWWGGHWPRQLMALKVSKTYQWFFWRMEAACHRMLHRRGDAHVMVSCGESISPLRHMSLGKQICIPTSCLPNWMIRDANQAWPNARAYKWALRTVHVHGGPVILPKYCWWNYQSIVKHCGMSYIGKS